MGETRGPCREGVLAHVSPPPAGTAGLGALLRGESSVLPYWNLRRLIPDCIAGRQGHFTSRYTVVPASRPLKKGVRRRCERRGAGCKEARRERCRGASERSADEGDGPAA